MSTASEILTHALALPPNERAGLAHSLICSLPRGPRVYRNEAELAEELNRRLTAMEQGTMEMIDADESFRLAREALARRRG